MSLDGFIADESGNFGWAAPDEEVHRFVNDLERPVGTYLYGRRMYETMVYWETGGDESDIERDFAKIWRSADKVVYSRTLEKVSSARTRVERDFDPEAVRRLKASAITDIGLGGAELAGHALKAGLVDAAPVRRPGAGRRRHESPACRLRGPVEARGGAQVQPRDGVPALRDRPLLE